MLRQRDDEAALCFGGLLISEDLGLLYKCMPVPRSEPVEGLVEAEGCLHPADAPPFSVLEAALKVFKHVFLAAVLLKLPISDLFFALRKAGREL